MDDIPVTEQYAEDYAIRANLDLSEYTRHSVTVRIESNHDTDIGQLAEELLSGIRQAAPPGTVALVQYSSTLKQGQSEDTFENIRKAIALVKK